MDENFEEFDLEFSPPDPKLHRRRMMLTGAVFLLTSVLVLYSIFLSGQSVDYFVNIDGYGVVQKGRPLALRFSAIGIKEQMPLAHLGVRVDMQGRDGETGRNLFKKYSKGEPYIWWVAELPHEIPAGEHRFKLRASTKYGPEDNEFVVKVSDEQQTRSVLTAELEEAYLKRSKPLEIARPEGTLLLNMFPNNGKYVPSLLNNVLVSLEDKDSKAPVSDFGFEVWLGNDLIAELVSDAGGLARFSYYPSGVNSHKLKVKSVLSDGATFEGEFEIFPWGAQIVTEKSMHFIEVGQPLDLSVSTLRPGEWKLDIFSGGNMVMHTSVESVAAKKPLRLQIPEGINGLIYVQIAADNDNPTHAFDAFFAYVYDKNDTNLLTSLEKALSAEADIYTGDIIDASMLADWSSWLKSIPDAETRREAAAGRILSALPKRYIVMPNLMDTRESKISTFEKNRLFKRNFVLLLLAIVGLGVTFYFAARIRQEIMASRQRGFGMDFRPNQALQLGIALFVVMMTYIALLYLLSTLNWHIGL